MLKLDSVPENETHKIIWYIEIQTDYLIPTKKTDIKKKIKKIKKKENLAVLANHRVKIKENKK